MTTPHDPEQELRLREKALEERELRLRLRELESELNPELPLHKTVKHNPGPSKFQRWRQKTKKIILFGGIIIGTLVVLNVVSRIASIVFGVMIIGAIAFVAYKLFFEERSKP